MDKESMAHLHDGVLLSCKNNDLMKFAVKWMELEKKIILSEETQTQKDKHSVYSLISEYFRCKAKDNKATIHSPRS